MSEINQFKNVSGGCVRAIFAMSDECLNKVYEFEDILKAQEQHNIETDHVLHAGIYTRTIFIPKGIVITGCLTKIPVTLVLSGDLCVYVGKDEVKRYVGHNVVPAMAGRKQIFYANEHSYVSMSFKTSANNIHQAEEEFCAETNNLISRKDGAINTITITGV